jgi:hypothetical protein
MGLRIWLPLNGDLENKGLDNIVIANNGATINDNGKIGKCYSFDGTNDYINITNANYPNIFAGSFSICFWVYSNTDGSRDVYFGNYGLSGSGNWFNIEKNTNNELRFWWNNGSPNKYFTSYNILNSEGWTHIALTRFENTVKVYKNGTLIESYTVTLSNNVPTTATMFVIGGDSRHSGDLMLGGRMNDFRLYDECLSLMQIKLISQGLVAHYLLNRNGLGATNLLKNGFGELGAENWQNASNMYDDVPANHPEIYHSYRNVDSSEFIPIYPNHEYKFSTWVKAASSSGSSYPSLLPYDVDKNFINYQNCREGFNLSTMTTLTQELKKGDTKIYVDDLSKWNANSGNYYNYAALFGYKDSTGYIYPDGVYTRDLGTFGSGTSAKTNLDKTNNIITLNSAYTGENKPVGTKVCASTAGATYFYPLGGISNTTITDWTYKEGTFSSEVPRLSAAKYVRVYAYSSCYQAGITLTDLTLLSTEDNIEYDVSGYCNNGTKYNITDYTSDTPRYSVATKFNGTNSYINVGRGGMVKDEITVNIWGYMDDWTTYNARLISCTEGGGWNFETVSGKIHFAMGTGFTSNTYKNTSGYALSELSSGWHMFTGTYDGLVVKQYIDGVLNTTNNAYTTKTPIYYHSNNSILIGAEATGSATSAASPYFNGYLSDVRIYATALSESDIQSLYNNSAFIDSSGNVYSTEYIEE